MGKPVPPAHLVIFGRPGSGKSTVAARLGSEFGYELIQTGELLRSAVRRRDALGKRVEEFLAHGILVSDELIFDLLEHHLEDLKTKKLLFDGFPRTMGQVKLLADFKRKLGIVIQQYLDIDISKAEAVARITGRRVCPACGANYHMRFKPPREDERCDLDATALQTRPDDTLEVVEVRQKVFEEQAGPVLQYYKTKAPEKCRVVNGEQSIEAVYDEACRVLELKPSAV